MSNPVIKLANETHHDKTVVSLAFEKDYALIAKVKSIKSTSWSQSRKFWYISKENFKLEGAWWHPNLKQWSALDTEENREQLKALLQSSELTSEFKIAEGENRTHIKTPKQKHQIILKLMYGCGLRRNEVCTLKTEDVNIDRELIFVKGKAGKYRPINPGKRLIDDVKEYEKKYSPGEYFIEGQGGGTYSGTSIAKIVERLTEKAGLKRKVTPHMFRHTFATHHIEKGTELRLIQEALGHASSKTTEIYTRVSRTSIKKMRNLLDDLEI